MKSGKIFSIVLIGILLFSGCTKEKENTTDPIKILVSFKADGVDYSFTDGFGFVDSPINFVQQFQDSDGQILQCPQRGVQFFDPSFINFQQFTIQFTNFCFNSAEFAENPDENILSVFDQSNYAITNTTFAGSEGIFMQFVNSSGFFFMSQAGIADDSFLIENTGYIPETATTQERIFIQGSFECDMYDGWSTHTILTDGKFLLEIPL